MGAYLSMMVWPFRQVKIRFAFGQTTICFSLGKLRLDDILGTLRSAFLAAAMYEGNFSGRKNEKSHYMSGLFPVLGLGALASCHWLEMGSCMLSRA